LTIVGFDTSTAATSACVLRADGETFEVSPQPARLVERPGHSRELLPAIGEAMRQAEITWDDVTGIAVGIGPGTFTGLRIGIATARALATARDLPVHPVSSLAVLAAGTAASRDPRPATRDLPLIDARRGEVFGAVYRENTLLVDPFVGDPHELREKLGNAARNALAIGDGSIRFRSVLEADGVRVAPDGSELHVVRGLHVCRLAVGVPAVAPEAVLPTYLREPDAQPTQ